MLQHVAPPDNPIRNIWCPFLLVLVAFRSVSSAPACFQFLTNSGSGAVCESDALFGEIVATAREMKSLGLWVAE